MSTTRVPEYREAAGSRTATRSSRPSFQITIDTEGDNLWATPREITTRNAEFLPRFQALSEKYALYRDLERLFSRAATGFVGATLGEFEQTFSKEGS